MMVDERQKARRTSASVIGPHTQVSTRAPRWEYNAKALQTREQILETARRLFLERGYAGTSVQHIAARCDLSRAAVYTYFTSKLEIFDALGTSTYKRQLAVISRLNELPMPCSVDDIREWVTEYHDFMEEDGAFMLAAVQGGPDDPEFHTRVLELTVRTARRCGRAIQAHSGRSDASDEAVGIMVMSALERTWSYLHVMRVDIEPADVLDAAAITIHSLIAPA